MRDSCKNASADSFSKTLTTTILCPLKSLKPLQNGE